jgi:hypothetical protein
LNRCEICEELTEEHSEDLLTKAYAIGNSLITKMTLSPDTSKTTVRAGGKLTDMVQDLWTDFSGECRCKRQARRLKFLV